MCGLALSKVSLDSDVCNLSPAETNVYLILFCCFCLLK